MTTKVKPLRNEYPPPKPVRPWVQPPNTIKYKVKTGDTWLTLGARNNHEIGEHLLIWINFKVTPLDPRWTDQVNWYLREYVGCRHSHDGGRNWAFTDDADPGYIFLPDITYKLDPTAITGRRGTGGVSAPQYDDHNFYDTLSKALDIFGVVDMGVQIWTIPVGLLAEAGFIVAGALAGVVGPAIAVGSGHNDALRKTTREFFFTGFCSTLVMRADNWPTSTVETFYPPWKYPPLNSVYQEKRESFRQLYNFGLKAGVLQARRMNAVDKLNLFTMLRSELTDTERQDTYPKDNVQEWSERKRKDYYDRLAAILKDIILKKNLKVKFR
jgi:hypothetical protein